MTRKLITKEIRDEILRRNIEDSLTIKELCKEYGFYHTAFFNHLKRNNIKTNIITNKSKINHLYFSNIDKEEKAYFLGLLFADGYIEAPSKNKAGRISLRLSGSDVYMVEKFKTCIKSDNIIQYKKAYTDDRGWSCKAAAELSFTSKIINKDLNKLGMFYGKTKLGRAFPDIETELIPHFIRGIFDGDGCLSVKQSLNTKVLNVGIYFPDLSFLESLNNYLISFNIQGYIQKTKTCYYLSFIKDKNIMKDRFLKYIYNNSSIYLNRKKELYTSLDFDGRYFY